MKVTASLDLNQKQCSKCKLNRSIEEFNFRNRSKGIRHLYCRECGREFTRNHYKLNKRQYIERSRRATSKRREYLREIKSQPCADCGVKYPFYVMDFDHREGEQKTFEMNQVNYVTMLAIKREIEKCDVVCANCHRERTYRRVMQREATRRR